jgi:RNA polymerase sigma factor (sigma-70 family)
VQRRSRHVGAKDYPSSTAGELLTGARQGDQAAWDEMVYRYTSLVMGTARAYRLTSNDALDVNQEVWLQLLLHVATIKEPEALPGWIATTARRACLRLATSVSRTVPVSPIDKSVQDLQAVDAEVDAGILRTEMIEAVRDGFAELPTAQRNLLVLLASSPPLSYRDISKRLGMPVGSIGPTRARALARLRTTRALQPFLCSSPGSEQNP